MAGFSHVVVQSAPEKSEQKQRAGEIPNTLQGKIKGRQGCVQIYKQGKAFLVKVPLQLSFEVLGCRHIMRQVTFLASNNTAS